MTPLQRSATTVVLGLGNVIMSDDGAGVRAAQALQRLPELPEDVTVVDGGTMGLELLSVAAGAAHLLVLDALDLGGKPGTVARLTGATLDTLASSASVHQLGLPDLLSALRMMGQAPGEVILLGVQPRYTNLGTELSPEVEQAIARLTGAALAEIRRWETAPLVEQDVA